MAKYRHLKNAPIQEALIDFRVQTIGDLGRLKNVGLKLAKTYPTREEVQGKNFQIQTTPEGPRSSVQDVGVATLRLTDPEKKNVVQLRMDGVAYSRLRPYQTSDKFQAEALRIWDEYNSIIHPSVILRVGVRYVNLLEVPMKVDLEGYLQASPRLPSEINNTPMTGFLSRIAIRDEKLELNAVITQAVNGFDLGAGTARVILDVDVFHEGQLTIDKKALTAKVSQLAKFEETIFFASITEKTAEMYA